MSPLNRGPLMAPRLPPAGTRQLPPPRFAGRLAPPPPPHGMPPRMLPPPLNPMFGPSGPRQRLPPPPPRPVGGVSRPNGMLPRFPGGPRARGMAPIVPSMGPRGSGLPRGPPMRPWPRRMPLPQMMPPIRIRYNMGNGNTKSKTMGNPKKGKIEELELKKPWMTDEIRNEIQRKNKLYAKAKKNKDAVEWEEFKDLRNKVTRMIRDAKNEYLAKHPEQAHLYPDSEDLHDMRDENYVSSDDDNKTYYCEVCDRDFPSEDDLSDHKRIHMICGIDGCTFSAHPSLVEKHISMQHRSGLYQKLKNLSTPEDIEKWIKERKKKYPTEDNIKLRKAEELEKVQRGEVIKQNYNIRSKTNKMTNVREKKRRPRKRYIRETNSNCIRTEETYRGLRPFAGITDLQEETAIYLDEQVEQTNFCGKEIDISDEDDIPHASTTPEYVSQTAAESTNLATVTSSLILPNLVADYESEDSDDGPEEVSIKKRKTEENLQDDITENTIHEENSTQVCEKVSNTQSCTNADDESNNKFQNTVATDQNKQSRELNRVVSNKNEKFVRRYHNQLLEKLLSRSIQHERNLICQCVKYIIENNFF
ncbi:PREDICTED: nuclear fragile X mental retardation-interacting protein 1-like, partial [Trachymyrmex septentrionalis]|uniref:nuclear fragile X mental retardation-interacting protein 1-like n=1 Tax=Trachymyrmex septentrionalis TaxID=34720 RepID=UPI00084F85D4